MKEYWEASWLPLIFSRLPSNFLPYLELYIGRLTLMASVWWQRGFYLKAIKKSSSYTNEQYMSTNTIVYYLCESLIIIHSCPLDWSLSPWLIQSTQWMKYKAPPDGGKWTLAKVLKHLHQPLEAMPRDNGAETCADFWCKHRTLWGHFLHTKAHFHWSLNWKFNNLIKPMLKVKRSSEQSTVCGGRSKRIKKWNFREMMLFIIATDTVHLHVLWSEWVTILVHNPSTFRGMNRLWCGWSGSLWTAFRTSWPSRLHTRACCRKYATAPTGVTLHDN